MAWHEEGTGKCPSFLFKLRLSANVKKLSLRLLGMAGMANPTKGACRSLSCGSNSKAGVSCERRVIVERTLKPHRNHLRKSCTTR
jgi:hypothetical protein